MVRFFSLCTLATLFFVCLIATPALAGQPYHSQINKIHAIGNTLDSVERRLDKLLMSYDGETTAPKGMEGKVMAMARKMAVNEKQLKKIIDSMSERKMHGTSGFEEALEELGQYAVRIAGQAQVGSRIPLDLGILDAFVELKDVSENLAQVAQVYFNAFWDKVIPVRFVQVSNCFPFLQSCHPNLDWDSIDASVDGLNEALHGIGLHFWIKSNERYWMPNFAHEQYSTGTYFTYTEAMDEINHVFPIDELNPSPYSRRAHEWVGYMTTIFSDPNELIVWVFDNDSLVSREIDHHSVSSFPNGGRSVIISARNIYNPNRPPDQPALSPYHLLHEIGHFFGIRHTWDGPAGINPYSLQPVVWADLWDLIYCTGELGFPIWFSNRQEAEDASCDYHHIENGNPINCHIDNRYGADDSDMRCTVPAIGGADYYSGYPLLKGLSFPTGMSEDPPVDAYDETYSFAWGLNVMGYYSRYNAHLWTPGRFSASQLDLIKGHTLYDVPITDNSGFYLPYNNLSSDRSKLGE